MRLGVFIGAFRLGQNLALIVHIVVALRRPINAVSPMQPGIEPLGRVRCRHLPGQHEAHLVTIGLRIGLGGEITTLPAPIGPSPGQPVKHLLGAGFADKALILRQGFHRSQIRHLPPQELRHAGFRHRLGHRRNPGLAEVFLSKHVSRNLAPALRHLDRFIAEHDLAIGIANFRCGHLKCQRAIGPLIRRGKLPLNLHCPVTPSGGALATPSLLRPTGKARQPPARPKMCAASLREALVLVIPVPVAARLIPKRRGNLFKLPPDLRRRNDFFTHRP